MLNVEVQSPRLHGTLALGSGIAAVVGLSGSGKTSLFRLIAGLERDPRAAVRVLGEAVDTRPAYERPTRYVPQRPSLIPHRTVGSQVAWVQRIDDARLSLWMDVLDLKHLWDRKPRHLSGGEQQRAALLRALATDPRLLLLDEALSNIDRPHRYAIWQALARQWPQDRLLVFSTHEWAEAEAWAETILYVESGQLFAPQPARQVVPLTAKMARLMGFIGALPWQGQWLWLHPDLLKPGLSPTAPVNLPGTLHWSPLTPFKARYGWDSGERQWEWTGPLPQEGQYPGIHLDRPVLTTFGEGDAP